MQLEDYKRRRTIDNAIMPLESFGRGMRAVRGFGF